MLWYLAMNEHKICIHIYHIHVYNIWGNRNNEIPTLVIYIFLIFKLSFIDNRMLPKGPPPFSRLQVSWEIYPHICRIGLNINAHGTNWIVHGINIIQANHHVPYVFILHIGQKNWVIGLFQIHMSQEIIWMCKHNNFSKF